jgi:hypothetical protein
VYVVEFLEGQANEYTIEHKKASGDIATHAGMEGGDIFFLQNFEHPILPSLMVHTYLVF